VPLLQASTREERRVRLAQQELAKRVGLLQGQVSFGEKKLQAVLAMIQQKCPEYLDDINAAVADLDAGYEDEANTIRMLGSDAVDLQAVPLTKLFKRDGEVNEAAFSKAPAAAPMYDSSWLGCWQRVVWPVLQRFETFSSDISAKYWQLDKDYKAKEDACNKLKAEVQASRTPFP
jgi:hypothetical protein